MKDFHTVKELFDSHEGIAPYGVQQLDNSTRVVSLRLTQSAHALLEELAERWGYSKSGMGSKILEVAMGELNLYDRMHEEERKEKAQKAAL